MPIHTIGPTEPPPPKLRPPEPQQKRSIKIIYQLSQSAQKDAWQDADAFDKHARADCSRLQIRWLSEAGAAADVWKAASELAWIDPRGTPIVFVGGREAYRWDEKQRLWIYQEAAVPGRWRVKTHYGGAHTPDRYTVVQQTELPLRVDRHDLLMEDLIDLEEMRRYDIKESEATANAKAGTANDAAKKRQLEHTEELLKRMTTR